MVEDTSERNEETGTDSTELEPLFSLVAGEGDGFMLGLAAGDTAGGAWELGYSAVTEQATVIAYDLIQHRSIDGERLTRALLELDGSDGDEAVYREETPQFRAWLDRAGRRRPAPTQQPSLDGVARASVIGVAYRHDPDTLISETLALGALFDTDPGSLAAMAIAAGAVAASCYAQSGRDLVAAVAEILEAESDQLGVLGELVADELPATLQSLMNRVGLRDADEAMAASGGDKDDPVQVTIAGLLLVAPVNERYHAPVEQAARLGGSTMGAFAGAVVGARLGIRPWPWAFANDTWFAEIGRRLVRGPDEVRDLPIPYAVEQHLMFGSRPSYL